MNHHVFISYRHADAETAEALLTILEANGIICWIDKAGIMVSEAFDDSIPKAIASSKALVIIVTDKSQESPKQQKREIMIAEKYQIPVMPVFVMPPEDCTAFDYLLASTQYIDASSPPLMDKLMAAMNAIRQRLNQLKLQELLKSQKSAASAPQQTQKTEPAPQPQTRPTTNKTAEKSLSVAMLYKRGAQDDEKLLALISDHLSSRGHKVFFDRDLQVGEEWRRAIREKVENADAVIPLISVLSVGSEMLEEELIIARRSQVSAKGTPRILPVRISYEGALPAAMNTALQGVQYATWTKEDDNPKLLHDLTESLERPAPPPVSVSRQSEMPAGAVPLSSPFYIVRPADHVFMRGVSQQDSIVLVKGARQMGKTSLIARSLHQAREKGMRVAISDFQTLNESDFSDIRSFYISLAESLANQLDIDISLEDTWNPKRAPNTNFERFIRKEVLPLTDAPLIWALDEADRLFPRDFGTEVFGLFRSWHNSRQLNPDAGWEKLTLVIGYATEASLFIKDVNMSPFNVGTHVDLSDFTPEEISDLNARYGHPLPDENAITRLMERVGGQPFLIRRSLYAMAVENMPFEELLRTAASDSGIFGDHLRRFYISLHRDEELESAVRNFIIQRRPLDPDQFHRLRGAGLIKGNSRQESSPRCGIYADYLREHLS